MATKKTETVAVETPSATQTYEVKPEFKRLSYLMVDCNYIEVKDGKITTAFPDRYKDFIVK